MMGLDWNEAEGWGETHQPLLICMFPAQPAPSSIRHEAGTLAWEVAGWGEGDLGWGAAGSN